MSEHAVAIANNELTVRYGELTSLNSKEKNRADDGIRDVMRATVESAPDVVKQLKPQEIYKIKSLPDGATIFVDNNGDLTGTCRKNGKFAGHVRLEKMGPQVAQLAKGIGQQVMLVHIANELRSIKADVESISSGLHDDRIARIQTGLKMLARAKNEAQYLQCIAPLQEGIIQVEKELDADLMRMPRLNAGFFDNWLGKSKTAELSRYYERIADSFGALVSGYEALVKCYVALPESNHGAIQVVEDLKSYLNALDFSRLLELCRHLPRYSYPEDIWQKLEQEDRIKEYFCCVEALASPDLEECCIEISGKELKELCYEL